LCVLALGPYIAVVIDGAVQIKELKISEVPTGVVQRYWLHICNDKVGEPIRIPLLVARGARPGPVLGLTAAVHGNELNGIPVVQKLFHELNVHELCGTVVGVLVSNIPGLLLERREFNDGQDLNRIAPGRPNGNTSQVYLSRLIDRVISQFEFHIDLHTASFGRVNSHYVRANMSNNKAARMARLQNAQIIVDNSANDTTLRGATAVLGIHSITVELCDPHVFQTSVIDDTLVGIRNVMRDQKMIEGSLLCPVKRTIQCSSSYWMFTDEGGQLSVLPDVASEIAKGQLVADVRTIFGEVTREYYAPENGIVVGKSVNPLNQTGSRILHLGVEPIAIPCLLDE